MNRHLKYPDSTRLLHVHPGALQSSINVSLQEVRLRENPEYEYLSYTWGTSVDETTVFLDGEPISIRYNLFLFLRRVRDASETRVVWVDALSISQSDLREKSQQVAMIGTIFRNAARVLVWLGEHVDNSEALFRPWPAEALWRRSLHMQPTAPSLQRRVAVWNAFISRPYWRRTWIVQEILSAKAIVVLCGADAIDWDDLLVPRVYAVSGLSFDGIDLVSSKLSKTVGDGVADVFRANVQVIERLVNSRWLYRQDRAQLKPGFEIIYTFPAFAQHECFDRRDKIYAMLSLEQSQEFRDAIGVDYTSDIQALFAHVLRTLDVFGWNGRLAASSLVKIYDMSQPEAAALMDYLASCADSIDLRCLAYLERYILEGITAPFSDAPANPNVSPFHYGSGSGTSRSGM